ncbi:ABC transporter ATP-binding protein [Fluviicola sp.]|uniref:ABC transporter ATP-binding protein n=1 Tax=Fluviicola sp. TaxID=1917219 RepID=UPI0031CFA52E
MNLFTTKLNQTREHLIHGDIDLGFRCLVDCVLDTQNTNHYRAVIDLVEWHEAHENDNEAYTEKLLQLTDSLTNETVLFNEIPTLLAVDTLVKEYPRSKFSIGPISLDLKAGEIWGLVGENGNGKTSLLRTLAQDLSYDSGTIQYTNELQKLNSYELKTHLAYIPQRTPKWHGSLKSNLKFAASQYGTFGEENELIVLMYIIRFGLWKFRHHRWSELSSGYKMRFELARTFLRKPKLLLLDEPLANLDVLAQQLILEDLKNMGKSLSNPLGIILSSQQLFEVEKVADKVIFLKQGKPVYSDHSGQADVNENTTPETILELDAQITKEVLLQILSVHQPTKASYNGGVFLLHFSAEQHMNDIMQTLINHQVQMTYIRDISKSTRRLFIQH